MELLVGVLAGVALLVGGIVVVGRRRRRDGWGVDASGPHPGSTDARGAVNRHSWMLGGGGAGGG